VQGLTTSIKQLKSALEHFSSDLQSSIDRFTQSELSAVGSTASMVRLATQLVVQPVYILVLELSETGASNLQSSVQELGSALETLNQITEICVLESTTQT